MSEDFDPYYKWLGIPPKDQPPHHYRLLSIELFEADGDVIDAAANRLMAYLQDLAVGEEAEHSQKLLNEIATARLCLLNPEKKAGYDAQLKAQRAAAARKGQANTKALARATPLADRPPQPVQPPPISQPLPLQQTATTVPPPPQPAAAKPQPAAAIPQPAAAIPQPAAAIPQPAAAIPQPAAAIPQPAAANSQPVVVAKPDGPASSTSGTSISGKSTSGKPARRTNDRQVLLGLGGAALLLVLIVLVFAFSSPGGRPDGRRSPPPGSVPREPHRLPKTNVPTSVPIPASAQQAVLRIDWPADQRSGALVHIDGREREVPLRGEMRYKLPAGRHQVTLQRDGHEPIRHSVQLDKGDHVDYTPQWKRKRPQRPREEGNSRPSNARP